MEILDGLKMYELAVPYPPSINRYYQNLKGSYKRRIRPEGLAFRSDVMDLVESGENDPDGLRPTNEPIDMNVMMFITAYPPDNRKRDIDNFQKALLDGLTHAGVYKDDSQIKALMVHMVSDEPKDGFGWVRVRLIEYGPAIFEALESIFKPREGAFR